MAYQAQDTTARDQSFRTQVRQAVVINALAVAGESSSTTNHAARSALATRVLNFLPPELEAAFAQACASDGTTVNGSTDAQVLARVATIWNAFAGGL